MRNNKSIEFGALRIFAAVANAQTLTHAAAILAVAAKLGWAIISALCLVRYPDLLKDLRVINLNSTNARYISQLSRKDELGQRPEQFAEISRILFTEEVTPQLN